MFKGISVETQGETFVQDLADEFDAAIQKYELRPFVQARSFEPCPSSSAEPRKLSRVKEKDEE